MAKVQFQVDGLDSNQASVFNQDVGFDLDITVGGNLNLNGLSAGYLVIDSGGIVSSTSPTFYSAPTIGSTSIGSGSTVNTIAGLTLTTPTIASFVNATHSHTNSAGGGTLTSSAISDFVEAAQDAVGNSLGTGLTYTDSTGAIAVDTSTIQSRVTNVSDTEIGYLDGVTSAIQTQIDAKAPIASPTFTGTVSGITKSMVGLGNVDNTTDANKPISTATQTALDLKAPLASPTFTGTVNAADLILSGNLTVNGTTTTVNSQNLAVTDSLIYLAKNQYSADLLDIGIYGAYGAAGNNGGNHPHTGLIRDASDGKWKLISGGTEPTDSEVDFTTATKDTLVIGALDATSATIGNVSNTELQYLDGVTSAIQTQIDAKLASSTAASTYAPIAAPIFTGTATAGTFVPTSSTAPTNGVYLPAANTIGISSNSTQRMTFDANGGINLLSQVTEKFTSSATAAATTVNYDVLTNKNILYYTSNSSANWTLNIRGNGSTSLDSILNTGQSLTLVFMVTNGSTAYYQTALQIDGTSVTPKWQGGTAPSAGNASSIDVYELTIMKTASATYTVLESISKFA